MSSASSLPVSLPAFGPASPIPAAMGTGKPAGAAPGTSPAVAFVDLIQELVGPTGSGLQEKALPEAGLGAQAAPEQAAPRPPFAGKPGNGAVSIPDRGRTARRSGVSESKQEPGAATTPLPIPGAAAAPEPMQPALVAPASLQLFEIAQAAATTPETTALDAPVESGASNIESDGPAATVTSGTWLFASPPLTVPAPQTGATPPQTGAGGDLVSDSVDPAPDSQDQARPEPGQAAVAWPETGAHARETLPVLRRSPARNESPLPQSGSSGGSAQQAFAPAVDGKTKELPREWRASQGGITGARHIISGSEEAPPKEAAGGTTGARPVTEADATEADSSTAQPSAEDGPVAAAARTKMPASVSETRRQNGEQPPDGAAEKRFAAADAGACESGSEHPGGLAFAARLSPTAETEFRVRRAGGAETAGGEAGGGQPQPSMTFAAATGGSAPGIQPAAASAQPGATGGDAGDSAARPAASPAAVLKGAASASEAAGPVAHDIKLEWTGAGSRVEVRMVERAGDVHVAVRTPDGRLAQAMRDDLPALAERLEQSGFHGNEWRAGAAGGSQRPIDIEHAAGAARDAGEHPGGRGGHEQQREGSGQHPRQRPHPEADPQALGGVQKTFAGLMSSAPGSKEEA